MIFQRVLIGALVASVFMVAAAFSFAVVVETMWRYHYACDRK